MPKLTAIQKFYKFLLIFLLSAGFFSSGYYIGKRGFEIELKRKPPQIKIINRNAGPKDVDFSMFWEVWDLINKKHISRPFDPRRLMYGAIKGLTQAVHDPYTSFLTPLENKTVSNALNGEYEGIGAELSIRNNQLIVVSPLEGSPAEKAGVKAGDAITKIEGKDTTGITLTEAVSRIRGPRKTISTLTLKRGDKEFEVKIKREKIELKSVSWKDKGDGIAYIRLSRFGEKTPKEWNTAVSQIIREMPNLKAVILDLRSNPGGFLDGSVYVASEFLESGTVVIQESADGSKTTLSVDRRGSLTKIPVVVLINQGSASASEIVAMALRDHNRAKVVGKKSFGKGTVQDAVELENGAGVHITIAKWLSPKGTWINGTGIQPDYEVDLTDQDISQGKDPQLDKAIEIAKEEANK